MTRSERGALLRGVRQEKKVSIFRLAVKTGLHPNTVMLAEKGAASERSLARIAKALGVKAAEFAAGGHP